MLGKLARGMLLFLLATLIVVYVLSSDNRAPAPPVSPDQIIGYLNA
jgi:hypothetical protein